MGNGGLVVFVLIHWNVLLHSGVRGGGKCPEEEHTTCSGGPTIVIVTSAVYGERENIYIKYKYILYKYKK